MYVGREEYIYIMGKWTPSDADTSVCRVPGYGVITTNLTKLW